MPETRQPAEVPASSRLWAHGDRMPTHRHTQGQLVYPASGLLAVTTRHGTWVAPANRATWTPAGFAHSHRAYGDTEVRMLRIPVAETARLPDRPAVFAVSPLLREVLLVLTGARRLSEESRRRLRQVAVDELAAAEAQSLYLPEPADDRLRTVTDRLYADPAEPATLTELGHAVGASERTLSRLFHTELAMSFHQWRTQLRVQYSLGLLADGHTVTDTATRCGWSNPTSFIQAFATILGQTPGRYQAQLRRPAAGSRLAAAVATSGSADHAGCPAEGSSNPDDAACSSAESAPNDQRCGRAAHQRRERCSHGERHPAGPTRASGLKARRVLTDADRWAPDPADRALNARRGSGQ